jgi:enoyl-[acyl-carrier-protein] reductase (NADH)
LAKIASYFVKRASQTLDQSVRAINTAYCLNETRMPVIFAGPIRSAIAKSIGAVRL